MGLFLWSCGSPNVPLTRPPQNAFRVDSTPEPSASVAVSDLANSDTPALNRTILSLTAGFFGETWPPQPSILTITARYFDLPWPPPPKEDDSTESETEPEDTSESDEPIEETDIVRSNVTVMAKTIANY